MLFCYLICSTDVIDCFYLAHHSVSRAQLLEIASSRYFDYSKNQYSPTRTVEVDFNMQIHSRGLIVDGPGTLFEIYHCY